jgi:hypothetical protein
MQFVNVFPQVNSAVTSHAPGHLLCGARGWMEIDEFQQQGSFGQRWRAARPGCGCGRPGCGGCALTARTVFVLQAELAWIVDRGDGDPRSLWAEVRPIGPTVPVGLPTAVRDWVATKPMWLERFRMAIGSYVARLGGPGPVDPRTLAEEVALTMAFAAARAERDPDRLLPPDVAVALPAQAGDYAWNRAEAAAGRSHRVARLFDGVPAHVAPPGDPLHPECWFDPL